MARRTWLTDTFPEEHAAPRRHGDPRKVEADEGELGRNGPRRDEARVRKPRRAAAEDPRAGNAPERPRPRNRSRAARVSPQACRIGRAAAERARRSPRWPARSRFLRARLRSLAAAAHQRRHRHGRAPHERPDPARRGDLVPRQRHEVRDERPPRAHAPNAWAASVWKSAPCRAATSATSASGWSTPVSVVRRHHRNQRRPRVGGERRVERAQPHPPLPVPQAPRSRRRPRTGRPRGTARCSTADTTSRSTGRPEGPVTPGASAVAFASVPPEVKITRSGIDAEAGRQSPPRRAPRRPGSNAPPHGPRRRCRGQKRSHRRLARPLADRRTRVPVEIEAAADRHAFPSDHRIARNTAGAKRLNGSRALIDNHTSPIGNGSEMPSR